MQTEDEPIAQQLLLLLSRCGVILLFGLDPRLLPALDLLVSREIESAAHAPTALFHIPAAVNTTGEIHTPEKRGWLRVRCQPPL